MKIVMISGKQGSGKTTLQKEIINHYTERGLFAISINFADILYEMHDAVLDILNHYWPKRDIVKDGPLLQLLGTEWGRKTIDQDIWVKALKSKLTLFKNYDLVIIGDCRFENEFDGIPEALRVRLECWHEIRKDRCSMWRENSEHPSEIGLDAYSRDFKFDLEFNTGIETVEHCKNLILTQIDKNVWIEKRK